VLYCNRVSVFYTITERSLSLNGRDLSNFVHELYSTSQPMTFSSPSTVLDRNNNLRITSDRCDYSVEGNVCCIFEIVALDENCLVAEV